MVGFCYGQIAGRATKWDEVWQPTRHDRPSSDPIIIFCVVWASIGRRSQRNCTHRICGNEVAPRTSRHQDAQLLGLYLRLIHCQDYIPPVS